MELLDTVLSPASIYNMLFFNIQAVREYKSLEALREANPIMADRWVEISTAKHIKDSGMTHEGTYLRFAPN
jgi:hypothetical protein